MKILFFAFFIALFLCSFARAQTGEINIIPKPQLVKLQSGKFKLNRKTKIFVADEERRKMAEVLNEFLSKNYGFKLEIGGSNEKASKERLENVV